VFGQVDGTADFCFPLEVEHAGTIGGGSVVGVKHRGIAGREFDMKLSREEAVSSIETAGGVTQ
jgi:hypothetical protein